MTVGSMLRVALLAGLAALAACSAKPNAAACTSTAAFTEIKQVIFYEARRRFRGGTKTIDDLKRDLLVTVASPTATGVNGGVTDCRGNLTVTIPSAYRDSFGHDAALTATIDYSSQATGDGGAYTVSGYDPVLNRILAAANTLDSPSSGQAVAAGAPVPSSEGVSDKTVSAASGSGSEQRAISLTNDYFSAGSGDADRAIEWVASNYAPSVSFFGKLTTLPMIMRDKRAFVSRWPNRSYMPIADSVSASCTPDGKTCRVTGQVRFDCYSDERNDSSRGVASFAMTIDFTGPRPLIIEEDSKVLSRR